MPRETFDAVLYAFIGLFKIMVLVFNLVPYLARRVVGGGFGRNSPQNRKV